METNDQKTRELCDEMVDLLGKYQELYTKGLINLSGGDIHVNEEFLLAIPGEMKLGHRSDTEFPYKYQKTYSGVTFFAITKEPLREGEASGKQG